MAERYEIKGRLGKGGVGAVYHAYDSHLRREVAIKRLLPLEETRLNESAEESLEAEARALAALSHPNIVTIYEFGEDESGPFVVFELVEGDTLNDVISGGALSEGDFYEVADQMLDALCAAKKYDILHRDIKPQNVMLAWLPSGKFQIKMLDFGLAKFSEKPSLQTLDQSGSFLGSIDYIAPEQIELRPLDQRTDLYSLGCLLYFALTQKPPFAGKTVASTMDNHLSGNATPLEEIRPDISLAVSRWVMKLISFNPDDRPSDAMAAMKELQIAKETNNLDITDNIPTAKPAVPINTSAQPIMLPPKLHETQQIISTPAPVTKKSRTSATMTSRRIKKEKPEGVSRKMLFTFIGSIVALFVVLGIVLADYNKGREQRELAEQRAREAEISRPPSPKPVEKISPTPAATTSSIRPNAYANSNRTTNLPELPKVENLVAYYSVQGLFQTLTGVPYIIGKTDNARPAVWENLAPSAHMRHLLLLPMNATNEPIITKGYKGRDSFYFDYGKKFASRLGDKNQPVLTSDNWTFALSFKPFAKTKGMVFKAVGIDSNGEKIQPFVSVFCAPEQISIRSGRASEHYNVEIDNNLKTVIIEYDGANSALNTWIAPRGLYRDPVTNSNPLKLSGDVNLGMYEVGLTGVTGEGRTEVAAISIHNALLDESEKRSLSIAHFKGAYPDN